MTDEENFFKIRIVASKLLLDHPQEILAGHGKSELY